MIRSHPVGPGLTESLGACCRGYGVVGILLGEKLVGVSGTDPPRAPSLESLVHRCIDTDSEFPASLPRTAFARGLVAFLSGLPEPLVSLSAVFGVQSALAEHRASGGDSGEGGAWTAGFLRGLSPSRHNSFLYVV